MLYTNAAAFAITSQRAEIKASGAAFLGASVLYLALIGDNERKEVKIVLCVIIIVTHRLSARGMCVGVGHGILGFFSVLGKWIMLKSEYFLVKFY